MWMSSSLRRLPIRLGRETFRSFVSSASPSEIPLARAHVRNVAIIAHVDHGKTTLVDSILRQSGSLSGSSGVDEGQERMMDSNALERERGITIMAKTTSVQWGDQQRLNIVDTPGHADFGGEVERVLSMVDGGEYQYLSGVLLVVDATDGPMPQTKYVLSKSLQHKLPAIVVINKVDRPSSRVGEVENEILDLFVSLDADDDLLDFPIIYASGRDGWAIRDQSEPRESLQPLVDSIFSHIPAPLPAKFLDQEFRMLVSLLDSDPFLGRILTGRITSGSVRVGDRLKSLNEGGNTVEESRIIRVLGSQGLKRIDKEDVYVGDIISLAGFRNASVGHTICGLSVTEALPAPSIDPPTISMRIGANDSPLAGKEGDKLTSAMIGDRLAKECEGNITIRVEKMGESYEVRARGELQLGILLENMRREGFEMSVSPPRVLFREVGGELLEPYEQVFVDVDDEYSGIVIEKMQLRKASLSEYKQSAGKTRLVFRIPARGLLGYRSELTTDTRGTAILNHIFLEYAPFCGSLDATRKGALISMETGLSTSYSLGSLEARGVLFIGPREEIYSGMVIGEHSRDNDLEVNPVKAKALTNFRAAGKDDAVKLAPPRRLSLEEAISYVHDDELIEITPQNIRLRKVALDSNERKRVQRQSDSR